jgi:trimeric autotransporter adhesin
MVFDDSAAARGQEFLDTLTWLQKADRGQPVSFFDAQTQETVTLGQALTAGQAVASQTGDLTPADMVSSRWARPVARASFPPRAPGPATRQQ